MSKETSCGIFKCVVLFIMLMYAISFASIVTNASTRNSPETKTRAKVMKYINKHVRKGKAKNFTVRFIDVEDLTCELKESRKKDKIIYVEITRGYVMSKDLDGITQDGYYISYRCLSAKLKTGAKIKTYCVYNPLNGYIDDIVYRTDRVLNTKRNKKQIKKAKKQFYANFGYSYDKTR